MKHIVNECVGCPKEMGCLGQACPNMNVAHYYCDKCGNEATLYQYDGDELCEECLLSAIPVVEGSEI